MNLSSQGKWALVTGASSGIGEVFAKRFAKEGWNVVLIARSLEKLNTLAQTFRDTYHIQALVIQADLSQAGSCAKVFREVQSKGIHVDSLVNNAGFGAVGAFLNIDCARQLEMIDLNVKALLYLTHLFLPAMVERKSGSVINVSSTASFQAVPNLATYSATKAFVTLFTEALWAEYRKTGVRIMNLCPGSTKTNFGRVAGKKEAVNDRRPIQTSEQVVESTFRAMEQDEPTIVTNPFDNTLRFFERFLPRKWVILATGIAGKRMGYQA